MLNEHSIQNTCMYNTKEEMLINDDKILFRSAVDPLLATSRSALHRTLSPQLHRPRRPHKVWWPFFPSAKNYTNKIDMAHIEYMYNSDITLRETVSNARSGDLDSDKSHGQLPGTSCQATATWRADTGPVPSTSEIPLPIMILILLISLMFLLNICLPKKLLHSSDNNGSEGRVL